MGSLGYFLVLQGNTHKMSVNRKCFKGTRHEVLLRHITKDSNWNVECVVQTHSPFKKSPFAGISTDR